MSDPETVNDSDVQALETTAVSPNEEAPGDDTVESVDLERVTADFDRIEAALATLDPAAPSNTPAGGD